MSEQDNAGRAAMRYIATGLTGVPLELAILTIDFYR
jgi:hypothetical protein